MPLFQDVDAKLTLTRVATAPVLIAEVAKLTGRRLDVSPTLNTEVLMVCVQNASSAEVLGKIAVAATAMWQPMEGGYRLVPDQAARTIEGSSERARRLQAITDSLKKKQALEQKQKRKAAGAKAKPDDEDDSDIEAAMMGGLSGSSKIDAFMPMLDLNAIVAMEAGDRLVFATNPNRAQRPLRGNPLPVVSSWIVSHNKTAKTMAGGVDEMPEEVKAFMQGPIGERFRRMSKPVTAAPAKVIVVATRGANPMFGSMGMGTRLEARAYGADGSLLIEETGSLDTDMMAVIAQMTKKPAATAAKSTPIQYSEDAKALIATSGRESFMMGGELGGLKLTPSLREKLFSPDKFEPLALIPGEGLAALAKARRKPLVASIPDAGFPGTFAGEAPKTIEEVEESLKTGTMRLVPDTTYLVVKAAEPATARRTRVDRTALAALLAAIADHETPTLDELSSFALKTVPPAQNDLSMAFLMKFAPGTMGSMAGMVSWDALRLYGSLSGPQRQTLASGGQVPFSNLGPAGQNALRAMLYGATAELTTERPGISNEPDIFSAAMRMMMGGSGGDARSEPTEVAPNGLPAGGVLQASVTSDSIIRPLSGEGEVYYSLGTDELAMFEMMSKGPLAAQMGEQMKLPQTGRLGSRTIWNLRGYVAPGVYVGSVLTDDRMPTNGQTVTLASLPPELQARVAAKAEKLKKSPLGVMMSMGAMARPQQAKP
ncbi:hypothetical protein EON82_02640 [bacterium]|nr:MAG: hypothetical protein EON82_02640 [bacterium]